MNDKWFLFTPSPLATLLEIEGPVNTPQTASYTITGNGDTTLGSNISLTSNFVSMAATATCVAAPPPKSGGGGSNTGAADSQNQKVDSQLLRELQIDLTKTVAANSGAAMTGAIDGAISDAFSAGGGSPINAGANGVRFNLAAEPQSDVARRTNDAFAMLGPAGGTYPKAPPRIDRDWSAWVDVHGTGFDRNDAMAASDGRQLNFTGGVGYKLTPYFLVGLFTGYEHFNYTVSGLNGKLSGDGGTVGAYAAYYVAPHLRVDGAFGWSNVSYAAAAGTAAGSFTGSRWLGTGALTGEYRYGPFMLEPSVRIYTLWEGENGYVDSLGTAQAARTFAEGRVATGSKVIYPWQATPDLLVSPYVGLYGDYRFSTDNALPVGVAFVGIKDGWSERVTTGFTMKSGVAGPSLSVGAELGGLGAGYELWSANARMNWQF